MLCYFIYNIWVDVRKLDIVVFTLPEQAYKTGKENPEHRLQKVAKQADVKIPYIIKKP